MAKAIKSMTSLNSQLNTLLNRVDFENFDFGDTKYDVEKNGFVLEDTSDFNDVISKIQTFKRSIEESKRDFIAAKERESFKQLAEQDDQMKQMLAQYFG